MRTTILILVMLYTMAFTPTAAAGCPNSCTLRVEPAQISPQIECITIREPEADDCDCEVQLVVNNACQDSIEPQGFSFTFCGNDIDRCGVIAPGTYGTISSLLTEVGVQSHVYPIKLGDTTAEISVVTDVASFDETGCTMSTSTQRSPLGGWATVMLVASAWIGTRRWRRVRGSRK